MMFINKLAKLLEKQHKRQMAALLAVSNAEQRVQFLIEEKQRLENPGQLPVFIVACHLERSEGSHCDIEPIGILRSSQNDNPQSQQQSIQNTERKI